jgi:glycosyltransferase involved in cell wall biosynthesis
MRVLQVHWTALPTAGGVEVHCASLTRQLAGLGVRSDLISGTDPSAVGLRHPALALGGEPTEEEIADLADECSGADVVHWHNPQWHKPAVTAAVAARLSASAWRGTLVLDLHNIDESGLRWAALADLPGTLVAHSDFVAGQVRSHLPGRPVHVLPLALDMAAEPYELPSSGAALTVLQPTRLTVWKGSDLSLTAMADLLDEGLDLAFVHAGTQNLVWPSNIPGELLERIRPWQERGRISFVHYSPQQSWSAIAAADLVVHPTADRGAHGEPFSLAVAQAIICGRPVVATDSGNLPALLAGYSGARLVPAGDLTAFTAAVRSALGRPVPADQPGDKMLAERLTADFVGAGSRHLSFYRSLMRGASTPFPTKGP